MTDEQIKHMVNRFLGWRLPENFAPDAGISFQPEYNVEWNAAQGKPPVRHDPVGTNLFDAEQATAMVRYMLNGMPDEGYSPQKQRAEILYGALVKIATAFPCRCAAADIANAALEEAAQVVRV